MTDAVLVEAVGDGITQITLNRPARLNAMNNALVAELHEAFDALVDDRSCRVVVLTGAGRGFCAGLDLSEGAAPPTAQGLGRVQAGMTVQKSIAGLVPKMRALPQPIVAAVNFVDAPFPGRAASAIVALGTTIGSLEEASIWPSSPRRRRSLI